MKIFSSSGSVLCGHQHLQPEIKRVWQANMQVYGVPKVWKQMNREGIVVARCTVGRLMKLQGLRGAVRGKRVRTTNPDTSAARPLDRVNRQFKAERPNQLWVSDFTYVSTWQGWELLSNLVYVTGGRREKAVAIEGECCFPR